jgi:hypothetical protein
MPREGYRNLSVPTEIVEALEEIVAEKSLLYKTVSDLAKEALRQKIIAIRSQNKGWKMTKKGAQKND